MSFLPSSGPAPVEQWPSSRHDGSSDDLFRSGSEGDRRSLTSEPEPEPEQGPPPLVELLDDDDDDDDKKEEEEIFYVEAILDRRKTPKGDWEYLIHWETYDDTYDTWEPEENLACDQILRDFIAKADKEDQARKKRRQKRTAPTSRKRRATLSESESELETKKPKREEKAPVSRKRRVTLSESDGETGVKKLEEGNPGESAWKEVTKEGPTERDSLEIQREGKKDLADKASEERVKEDSMEKAKSKVNIKRKAAQPGSPEKAGTKIHVPRLLPSAKKGKEIGKCEEEKEKEKMKEREKEKENEWEKEKEKRKEKEKEKEKRKEREKEKTKERKKEKEKEKTKEREEREKELLEESATKSGSETHEVSLKRGQEIGQCEEDEKIKEKEKMKENEKENTKEKMEEKEREKTKVKMEEKEKEKTKEKIKTKKKDKTRGKEKEKVADELAKEHRSETRQLPEDYVKVKERLSGLDETKGALKEPPVCKKKMTGFDRGLEAQKILGATVKNNYIRFLIKWKDTNDAELVPADLVNARMPQMVIKYYEDRITWEDAKKPAQVQK